MLSPPGQTCAFHLPKTFTHVWPKIRGTILTNALKRTNRSRRKCINSRAAPTDNSSLFCYVVNADCVVAFECRSRPSLQGGEGVEPGGLQSVPAPLTTESSFLTKESA